MLQISGRNVNTIWGQAVNLMRTYGQRADSRAGPVLVAPCPVITVYQKSMERVLFDPTRDANPFFHLFESLWMLSGRDDAAFLDTFVRDFGQRFAEPDGRIHGAYGARWRWGAGFDQLNAVVEKLRANPDDRQCVLQMWDATSFQSHDDLTGNWHDRPCNTHVYLRVRESEVLAAAEGTRHTPVLDLTVCCRSNDIVWGAYGANAVHFSVLQEYLAGRIGVGVGTMYQFSNNWHAYVDMFYKVSVEDHQRGVDRYAVGRTFSVRPMSMGIAWDRWDVDLERFMDWTAEDEPDQCPQEYPTNPWFHEVAEPMFVAHMFYRQKDPAHALEVLELVKADDWREAAREWIERRNKT